MENNISRLFGDSAGPVDMESSSTLAVIGPDGNAYGLTLSLKKQGSLEKVINELGKVAAIPIMWAGNARGSDYHINLNGPRAVFTIPQSALAVHTTFAEEEVDGIRYVMPTFRLEGAATVRVWTCPPGIKMAIIFVADQQKDKKWLLNAGSVHLVQVTDKGFRVPQIPNVYADGRVCTGRNPATPGTLLHAAEEALVLIHDTRYNSDLSNEEHMKNAKRVFRWDASGTQSVPDLETIKKWKTTSTAILMEALT